MLNLARKTRPYRQTARAEAVSASEKRMLEAFLLCTRERWFEEITLEEVAHRAKVSVRTVIRRYGGKDGLVVAAARSLQSAQVQPAVAEPPGDAPASIGVVIASLLNHYEKVGDDAVRLQAQARRYPALAPLIEHARQAHRERVQQAFASRLERTRRRRDSVLEALAVACDVHIWQVARRDMGHSLEATRELMERLVRGILAER
jgi:AcrR family transcriptional regulator